MNFALPEHNADDKPTQTRTIFGFCVNMGGKLGNGRSRRLGWDENENSGVTLIDD